MDRDAVQMAERAGKRNIGAPAYVINEGGVCPRS